MFIKLFNKKISTSVVAVLLTVIVFILLVFFIIIFRVEDKTISIISFYEQPVTVNIRGQNYEIKPYDTTVITLNTSKSIDVSVSDTEKTELQKFKIENISRGSQLITIALNQSKGYCFFSSEITSNPDGNYVLKNKTDLASSETNYSITDMNVAFADYVYPGKVFNVEDNKYSRPIRYTYPISCNLVDDEFSVINTIYAFSEYSAEDQLKYLNDIRTKLSETSDLENLNSAVPTKVEKYYVSEEKYILIYE